jgi:hypothetical protein
MIFIAKRVAAHQLNIRERCQLLGRDRLKIPIHFHRDHFACHDCKRLGQRPHPCTDFQNHIAWTQFRSLNKQIEQVQVDQKILTILGLRLQSCSLKRLG